jgi:hypothetical protein
VKLICTIEKIFSILNVLHFYVDIAQYFRVSYDIVGRAVVYLVEALCYKPEGRGIKSR